MGLWFPAHAQNQQCRTAPVGTSTANCASEAFVTQSIAATTREKLTAARSYYVRTDGNDACNGLVNSAGSSGACAFLTIQKAIDVTAALDMSIYQVTVQVNAGTFTGANILKPYVGALPPIIVGDEATPSNIVISTTGADCFVNDGGPGWHIRGMRLKTTTTGFGLDAINGGRIFFQKVDFNSVAAGYAHLRAFKTGIIQASGSYTVSGGGDWHLLAVANGLVDVVNAGTVTVSGTPAFATAFAYSSMNSTIYASGATYSGAATGQRYAVILSSVIYTGGGGANFFPGSIAGTVDASSVYG